MIIFKRVVGCLTGVYLLLFLQISHAGEKAIVSSCWRAWAVKNLAVIDTIKSNLVQSTQQLRENFFPTIDYFDGPVLDQNDTLSIRQALSVSEGDGAAIVNINPFTPEIAEKVRQAIHDSFASKTLHYTAKNGLLGLGFNFRSYEEDWRDFKRWLLSDKGTISSEEIDQFRREVDEYLHQVKQIALRTDGHQVKLKFLIIRTDKMIRHSRRNPNPANRSTYFILKHKHTDKEYKNYYLGASIAPVGLSTYYMRAFEGDQQKVLSRSGNAVIMTELGRITALSEEGEPPTHGTPGYRKERLVLLSEFQLIE